MVQRTEKIFFKVVQVVDLLITALGLVLQVMLM